MTLRLALALALCGCRVDAAEIDGIFYAGDGRRVHCALSIDDKHGTIATIDGALDRALERAEIVELYAHNPGGTVALANLEHVLAGARDRGLAFATYAELAAGIAARPGIALSFDDTSIPAWWDARPLFQAYGARVTFFISRYNALPAEWHALVPDLAGDGHEIAAHTVLHLRAPTFVEEHGLDAYVEQEVLPSIEILRDEGYTVTSFAYPNGARTNELDDALLEHVSILRSISSQHDGSIDPCPH